MTFNDLGLSPKVLAAVERVGYTEPTPIQAGAIPHVLQKRDVLGTAQTGTGKTASFTLPMLTLLEKGRARTRMPRTLILEPTRELAAQVEENFKIYGSGHKLNVALLIGGVSFDEQEKKLVRGADVLIATPGRLLDHFERGKLLLTGVEILVIDEADRMLDMGFIPDIERICKLIPFTRQTLFFSATMPKEIQKLADQFLHNPARIEVAARSSAALTVTQNVVHCGSKPSEKRAALRQLIDNAKDLQNAIIFCNRKRDVATVARSLERHGYNAGALHGDMDQHARMKMLASFKDLSTTLLVASDVAARGLDIPEVSHVFNFDVPTHAEDYVHRIGRTGRAGRSGTAFTLVSRSEQKYLDAVEKLLGIPLVVPGSVSQPAPEKVKSEETANTVSDEVSAESGSRRQKRNTGRTRKPEKVIKSKDDNTVSDTTTATVKPGKATRDEDSPKPRSPRTANRRKQTANDNVPFAEADHVPAFLLRSVNLN
uniref:DEAD/DEAH box helicase n=1 Tax=Pararhizobium sp. IMCC3301 TaxID=3067904 RepID=UPI002740534A|nr:DEAD/DEAH box helicase [Pararhizobium sp. IMCC3301]